MQHPEKNKKLKLLLWSLIIIIPLAALAGYFVWEQAPEIAAAPTPQPAAAIETDAAIKSGDAAESTSIEKDESSSAVDSAEEPAQGSAPSPTPEAVPTPEPTPTPDPLELAEAPLNERQDGVYTVLLVGEDKWSGNTDTILVGKIDTLAHKMDFVSLPRDTLINVDWDVRKLNSVYYKARNAGQDPAEQLKKQVANIIGFPVDCYAVIDLEAFIEVVDTVGGVEFDVPQDIYLEDYTLTDGEWQESYYGIYKGRQTLSGSECMALVRYRHGYEGGDMDRIRLQHDFLRACAEQFISPGNIPNVGKVIDILAENIDTDLSAANIAYFFRQALLCKAEDIRFHTMPTTPKMLGGYSYAVIIVYQWRDMINEVLNPYTEPVTINHLNVMFNDYIGIGCTREAAGPWYYVGAAEADLAALYGGQY